METNSQNQSKKGEIFFKTVKKCYKTKSEPKCSKKVSKFGEFYRSKIEMICFPHYCAKICTQKKDCSGPKQTEALYAFFHDARLLTLMRLTEQGSGKTGAASNTGNHECIHAHSECPAIETCGRSSICMDLHLLGSCSNKSTCLDQSCEGII